MSISESDKFRSSHEGEQEEYISSPEMDYETFAFQTEFEGFNQSPDSKMSPCSYNRQRSRFQHQAFRTKI